MAGNTSSPEQLWAYASISRLNETRGVVDLPLQETGINPDQRVNLATLAGAYGCLFDSDGPVTAQTDKDLHVFAHDFSRAEPEIIKTGLYIPHIPPRSNRRLRLEDSLITIGHQPVSLEADGVVPHNTGVVFPPDEFVIVARNAADFVKAVKNRTANVNTGKLNREEVIAKKNRSAAHAMEDRLTRMDKLEDEIIEETELLRKVFRQTRSTWRAQYKAKNLDKDRKIADELIHETAEISGGTFNLGTTAISALHRAITSNLYRRGSSNDLLRNWDAYLTMTGQYANARRGKIWQSRADCEQQLGLYAHSLIEQPAAA